MKIVFRCDSCETINDIPAEYMFRFCRTCGKIITYPIGEAVIYDQRVSICEKFLSAQKLSVTLAEKFFDFAEEDENDISQIIAGHENKGFKILDLPAASISDTVLLVLKESKTEILDDILRNCSFFNISKSQFETILLQLKKEGIVYQPKSWLIKLT
ncbi:MAG: hypothetical protein ACXAAM_01365 [Candidatus Heimdallarchaeaceae archaeon]|jgi:hypothetical protein